jgi:hypothetical protein
MKSRVIVCRGMRALAVGGDTSIAVFCSRNKVYC